MFPVKLLFLNDLQGLAYLEKAVKACGYLFFALSQNILFPWREGRSMAELRIQDAIAR